MCATFICGCGGCKKRRQTQEEYWIKVFDQIQKLNNFFRKFYNYHHLTFYSWNKKSPSSTPTWNHALILYHKDTSATQCISPSWTLAILFQNLLTIHVFSFLFKCYDSLMPKQTKKNAKQFLFPSNNFQSKFSILVHCDVLIYECTM